MIDPKVHFVKEGEYIGGAYFRAVDQYTIAVKDDQSHARNLFLKVIVGTISSSKQNSRNTEEIDSDPC